MFLPRLLVVITCGLGTLHLLGGCGEDHPDLPEVSVDHVYSYGETISFAAGGDAHRFRTTGWSHPEPSGTWTDGPAASLVLRLYPADGPLRLTAKLWPNIKPPRLEAQNVHVYVRGEKIGSWRVAGTGVFTAIIPRQLVNHGGLVSIDFHVPGAISLRELENGADTRRLGVFCQEITISKADALGGGRSYSLGSVVRFGAEQGAERYEVSGWSNAERDFTWTEGTSAALQFQVPRSPSGLILRVRMRGMSRSAEAPFQPTDVFANGKRIAHWEVGEPAEFQATIPPRITNTDESLQIEFRTPMAISPSQLGGGDPRVLGVCVFELQLTGAG